MTENVKSAKTPFKAYGIWFPGVVLMRNMGFRTKAIFISAVFLLPTALLLFWLLHSQDEQAMQDRMVSTQQHVEVAHSVLVWAHSKQASGELTLEAAQGLAKQAVSKLRYDKDEYFWINDMTPTVVMHPFKPELDGKSAADIKDPKGLALFVAFADTVRKNGQGFVSYMWPKAGSEQPVEKISFVKGFEPWGWVIGSGIYLDDLRAQQSQRQFAAVAGMALALVIAGYVFIVFYKVNQGGMRLVSHHLTELADGDIRNRPPMPWGKDEPAILIHDLHRVYDAMDELIRRIRHSARELNITSAEVSRVSLDLAQRTEDAASNLGVQATSVASINTQTKQSAQRTQEAAIMAQGNADVAEEGGKIIANVVSTMREIEKSSSKISEIIGVIDAIAFQTNILALNAAVEAARAGDSGRGFAVVASEVRALAGRSAKAAQEIKALISESVASISVGTHVVEGAGRNISELVANAKQINHFLEEIADATRTQAAGVDEVVNSIVLLDTHTQHNAKMVQETSASAESLSEQANRLINEIARFKVG